MRARFLVLCLVLLLPGLLGGCGHAAPAATPAEQTITITLHNGGVSPSGARRDVALGSTLRLVIDSDRADTVHLHGYDVEIPVRPGDHVTRTLKADRPGRYEVESHQPVLTIVFLNIR